jgi:chorismate mutase
VRPLAIRGATTVNSNNAEDIKTASLELIQKIVQENSIEANDIIMLFITMTNDLTSYNAASAIRLGMNWSEVPFFTSQEPHIDGGLEKCIRVLVQIQSAKNKSDIKHVYLGKAAALRPDLKTN